MACGEVRLGASKIVLARSLKVSVYSSLSVGNRCFVYLFVLLLRVPLFERLASSSI